MFKLGLCLVRVFCRFRSNQFQAKLLNVHQKRSKQIGWVWKVLGNSIGKDLRGLQKKLKEFLLTFHPRKGVLQYVIFR